ncbi:hypothetical protein F4820DRAFT_283287 [Hypoxylon rubiginosum]|uniref:Uncharacterized protein n=1 Tax=Hypoxylon rubiginosum TaxID=110542 RepID=A0ACB9Z1U4_9PEZI|nr:hypothetical protein F4820DRAFT_283287 [Hypoxylon rubiginosum]
MVSKYWIKEHLGPLPHTFVPGKSRSRSGQADAVNVRKRQENDKNYTPSNKPRTTSVANESDEELEVEKPRRTPRSVLRPDYAELVANKDPWNLSDMDSDAIQRPTKESLTVANGTDNTSKSSSSASASSRSRSPNSSKTSTPGPSLIRAKTTEPSPLAIRPNSGQGDRLPARGRPPRQHGGSRVMLIDGHILKISFHPAYLERRKKRL